MEINKINKITDEMIDKIKSKSPLSLPNNPAQHSWKAPQIKKYLSAFVVGQDESVIAEINRIVDECNAEITKIIENNNLKVNTNNGTADNLSLTGNIDASNAIIEQAILRGCETRDTPQLDNDIANKKYVDEALRWIVAEYDSFLSFPTIGKTGVLYVDKKENSSYRYDENELRYFCVGRDYKQIEIINGGILNNG